MVNVVILCGGSGTRLWPLSTEQVPKQFLDLVNDKQTLFQSTCIRANFLNPEKIIIICNQNHKHIADLQLKDSGLQNVEFIIEPMAKNTCASICAASNLLPEESNVLVLASDHIWENDKFVEMVNKGMELVNSGIVVFGIKPSYAETGYGYINYENNKLLKFTEKPDIELAKNYLESGKYLWNSGNLLFSNKQMRFLLNDKANDIYTSIKNSLMEMENKNHFLKEDIFKETRSESIDYAVLEKLDSGYVVEYEGKWSDIGSFESLHKFLSKNQDNNFVSPNTFTENTQNCLILGKKIIATLGLENIAILDTDDALLVTAMESSQDVKKIVDKMNSLNKLETKFHNKVYRPWGWYMNIDGNDYSGSKVKRICVYPGSRLSLQSHNQRSEHWVITKGSARVQIGNSFLDLLPNQSVFIPKEVLHRIENTGTEEVEFIETQIGQYLGEDDIVRHEDDYGRI